MGLFDALLIFAPGLAAVLILIAGIMRWRSSGKAPALAAAALSLLVLATTAYEVIAYPAGNAYTLVCGFGLLVIALFLLTLARPRPPEA